MPYWRPIDVVLLAVAGSGVDGAGALLQRHVIGQNAQRIALEKRMAEDRAFEPRALETWRARCTHVQPHASAVACSRSRATM